MFDTVAHHLRNPPKVSYMFRTHKRGTNERRYAAIVNKEVFEHDIDSPALQKQVESFFTDYSPRMRNIVVVRDVHTNLCVAFPNFREAMDGLGYVGRDSVRRRANAVYECDGVYQFIRIKKPTCVAEAFPEPLQPFDQRKWRNMRNVKAPHIYLRNTKTGEEKVLVTLQKVTEFLHLTAQAVYNLLLTPNQPMYFTDWVLDFASMAQVLRLLPGYTPKSVEHAVISAANADAAMNGMYMLHFGRGKAINPEDTKIYWDYCVRMHNKGLIPGSYLNIKKIRRLQGL